VVEVLGYEINWRAIAKTAVVGQVQSRQNFLPAGRNEVELFASLQDPHRDDVAR
jgi:hypothetical protein